MSTKPDVATVHVRTLARQRFRYAVATVTDDEER
jgi:hypothetical protein